MTKHKIKKIKRKSFIRFAEWFLLYWVLGGMYSFRMAEI